MTASVFWTLAVSDLLLCLAMLAWSLKERAVHAIFWAGILYSYGLPVISDAQAGEVSLDVLMHSALFACGFLACYAVTQIGIRPWVNEIGSPRWVTSSGTFSETSFNSVACAIFVTGVALLFWSEMSNHADIAAMTWAEARTESNSVLYPIGMTCTLSTSGVGALLWVRKRRKSLAVFIVAWLAAVILLRIRVLLIPAMLPFVIVTMIRPGRLVRKSVSLILIAGSFLVAMGFVRALRWAGTLTYDDQMMSRGIDMVVGSNTDSYVRADYYQLLELVPTTHPYLKGDTFLRVLLLPVPWSMFPGLKPEDSMYIYARYMGSETEGESVHPLVLGDAYANFGNFGVLLGSVYALSVAGLERYIRRAHPEHAIALFGPVSTFITLVTRGSVYNACLFLISGMLSLHFMARSLGLVKRPSELMTRVAAASS